MLVQDYLIQLAKDLNDYDGQRNFVRWRKSQLLSYVIEGVRSIYSFFYNDFAKFSVLKLNLGSSQLIPVDLDIIDIIYQCDKEGNCINEIKKDVIDRNMRWDNVPCLNPGKEYKIEYYRWERSSKDFFVYPPVPEDTAVYVKIKYCELPFISDYNVELELKDELYPLVTQWVLYRCMSIDDDTYAQARAQQYYNVYIGMRDALLLRKGYNELNLGDVPATTAELKQRNKLTDDKYRTSSLQ